MLWKLMFKSGVLFIKGLEKTLYIGLHLKITHIPSGEANPGQP